MDQYCFARWCLSSVVVSRRRRLSSSSVTLPVGRRAGRRARGWSATTGPAAGPVGGRTADTARRASTVTSRQGNTFLYWD